MSDAVTSRTAVRTARVLAALVCAITVTVMFGWQYGIDEIKRIIAGLTAMNPVTAVSLGLLGVCIIVEPIQSRAVRRFIFVVCSIVIASALIISAQLITGSEWHLDQVLFHARIFEDEVPNRMAPNTALALILLPAGLACLATHRDGIIRTGQVLALMTFLVGTLGLLGYAYSARPLYRVGMFNPMALHTAAALSMLSYAALCLKSRAGWVAEITSRATGGVIARRLLPFAIFVPAVLGFVRYQGERARWYDAGTGVALMATVTIALFTLVVFLAAISLNRLDRARALADEELRRINVEMQNLNAELAVRARGLEAANSELEAFSYSVSHDLRAPLRHLSGFAELLKKSDGANLSSTQARYVDVIQESARQMGRLIDDLLAFSRTSRVELRTGPCDVGAMVAKLTASLSADHPQRKIQWTIGDLPVARADESLLRIVWSNLLSNAVKYTGTREVAEIEIGCEPQTNGREMVFFVRDNGVGFDMQYAQKLFGVFQRLHDERSGFEGTGIGLATVRRIITRHGGRTWAQAEVDCGATIFFSLPGNSRPAVSAP